MTTICGKDCIPKGIGTVSWSWTNDEEQLKTNRLKNVLYFTDSPSNILSATALAESMKDYEETWVLTKRKYFFFTWDFGKYKKTIVHSENCLPELDIQAGFSKFAVF